MGKYFYIASLILNGIFIILFLSFGLKYKEKILQKYLVKKRKAKIVLFGDSLTENGKWSDLLKRRDVRNSGIGGFTTSHFRLLIKENVLVYNPEICFLQGGINDIIVGIPLERIMENFQSIIDTLISNNITLVVNSVIYEENNPESKVMIDSLNNFLINYCQQKSVWYLDINSKLSTDTGLKPEYSLDGTHLTESAYLVWSKEILEIFKVL